MVRRAVAVIALVAGVGLVLAACGEQRAEAAPSTTPPSHVDSILPRAEALRRFQASAREVTALAGGESSRDALVRQFVLALERRDTATLHRLVLDRNEFAFLYYPTAPQGLPPYDLEPGLLWFTLQSGSGKGLARLLESRAGRRLELEGYDCTGDASHQGENVVWGPCAVRYRRGGKPAVERLFGLIVQRDGQFKFVSYANRL